MELTIPVSAKEYESAGSKFITFPANAQVGDVQYRDVKLARLTGILRDRVLNFL
jgi:hypothetical protein